MKILLALTLLSGPAHAAAMPTKLVCSKLTYTIECQTNLPMPCPAPPPVYPMPFVEASLNGSSDGRYQAGQGRIFRAVDVEGTKFQLSAEGSYSANADGSNYSHSLTLELTETVSGWASLAQENQADRLQLLVKRTRKLDNRGKIATSTGHFVCELR